MSDVDPVSPEQTAKVLAELETWKEVIEETTGPFNTEVLLTGRVLLRPRNVVGQEMGLPHVAYMSDDSVDARLCVDDFVPEIGDPTMDPEFPSDNQPGG